MRQALKSGQFWDVEPYLKDYPNLSKIDEKTIARHLYVPEFPDADLIWRTSGEQRLSNFMLYQAAYAELVEQLLRVAVIVKVDIVEGMAVARQEFLHPESAGAVRGPEHDDVADVARDQLEAPQDERAHQDLPERAVGLHEGEVAPEIPSRHVPPVTYADLPEPKPLATHGNARVIGLSQEIGNL